MMEKYNLKLNIHAQNEILKIRNKELKRVLSVLKEFDKTNITKTNNELLKKVKDKLNFNNQKYKVKPFNIGDYATLQYLNIDVKSCFIYLDIKICLNGKDSENKYYCLYKDLSFRVATCENFTIKEFEEFKPSKLLNYNVELNKINSYNNKIKELEQLKNKILVDNKNNYLNKVY